MPADEIFREDLSGPEIRDLLSRLKSLPKPIPSDLLTLSKFDPERDIPLEELDSFGLQDVKGLTGMVQGRVYSQAVTDILERFRHEDPRQFPAFTEDDDNVGEDGGAEDADEKVSRIEMTDA